MPRFLSRTHLDPAHGDPRLQATAFLRARLPEAQRRGKELVAGDLHGHPGRSFRLNTDTGVWSDFATGESGGDVTALVAAQEGLTQGQAGKLVAETLGLASSAPLPKKRTMPEAPVRLEYLKATFEYHDEQGRFLFAVDRYEAAGCGKAIRQWRLDEEGRRVHSLKGVRPVPFRLPELLQAETVFIVEGEPKVLALLAWGLAATCNPMGAGKWRSEYNAYFHAKQVVILPDQDTPGRRHAVFVRHQDGAAGLYRHMLTR